MAATWLELVLMVLTIISLVIVHSTDHEGDDIIEEFFDVKPGGKLITVNKEMDKFSCGFTYAAQGGTHESWVMTISRSPDKSSYSCSVERPGGRSYLFFQQFKLKIKGAKLEEAAAFGDAESILRPEEYSIDKVKNKVTSNEDSFRSQLSKIMVFALKSRKTEL
ncbi:myeloid-derived growth factor-like isoform X1 [Ptychodera flava]|uniref:myeloid-derived growth factor-like isoform X1 n=1 Tax=Ptychodera flava TaxID=63121 RepID=UPI00396A90E8